MAAAAGYPPGSQQPYPGQQPPPQTYAGEQPSQQPYPGQPPQQPYPGQQPPQQPYSGQQPPQQPPAAQGYPGPGSVPPPGQSAYPGTAPPGYPGAPGAGAAPPAKGKINPDDVPSPVDVQAADQAQFVAEPYRTMSKTVPPLPTTRYMVLDEGIASPRFIRMTTNNVPCTEELLTQSALPLAAIVQPLAELEAGEAEIAVLEPGTSGPVRCRRCRAYINPMMPFIDGGRKFVCNFCAVENEVPADYFSNLDMSGRRSDIMQRPELRYGTVEYVAGKEFYSSPPQPLAYVIAIDVSWNAVQSGLLAQMASIIRDWLYSPDAESRFPKGAKVGILTYDKSVHFYNFHPTFEQFQMLIVSDVDDMFVPISEGFVVDPFESRLAIESFLDALPTLFQDNRATDSVLGAVVQAVVSHLKTRGGRMLIFHTSLPTSGPGALKQREDPKAYGTHKEKDLFMPAEPFWVTLAKQAVEAGVCIDQFLFPYSYMDVATIGTLSATTGGSAVLYPQFTLARDGARLHTDVLRSLSRAFGSNALMRVRVSTGLKITDHLGNFYSKDGTDLELAGIDADKAIAVALRLDGKLEENKDAAIQVALLYTSATGSRRIRVHTISLSTTTLLGNVFRFAELDTAVNFLAKSACAAALSMPLSTVREHLTDKCVKVLTAYRQHCASGTSPGQLILPETLKLLPVMTLALQKNRALRAGDLPSDLRVASMRELRSMATPLQVPLLYPRMFALHRDGEPVHTRVSYERLDADGCYLLENGQVAMLWLGRNIDPEYLRGILGAPSLAQVDVSQHVIAARDHPASHKLQAFLGDLAVRYKRHLAIQIVRQGMDQQELEFVSHMTEDKNHEAMPYVDFLVLVHRQIHAAQRSTSFSLLFLLL
ncbi:hypothetical protein BC828DRAFT_344662 [Blastocladiella britannica]|nr:hypothetical protein BC828DRAFT_344662 [Blastocladiella britannica]